jgi:peptide/nickel transport system substrate-binding protein
LGCALVILVVACGAPARDGFPSGGEPVAGAPSAQGRSTPKRVVVAVASVLPSLSYVMASGGVGVSGLREFEPLVSAGLGRIGATGAPEPVVAEVIPTVENGYWKTFPDGRMETTWKLKPTALWHDGRPLTAVDAHFSMALELDQDIPMRRTPAWRAVASVETPDTRTIVIHWKQPYIEADKTFVTALFPKHLLERAYLEQKEVFTDLPYWTTEFVGNGPFRIRELAQGSHVLLEANPDFVLGRPNLDEVEVKFVPDPTTLAANVLAGAVELNVGRGVSLEQGVQVREQWRGGKVEFELGSWFVIYPQFLNPSPRVVGDPAEPRLRRALMYAMDREELTRSLQWGLVPVAETMLPPTAPDYKAIESSIVLHPYDPRRAVQLVEEMGYRRGADGTFRDAAGAPLAVELRASPDVETQIKIALAGADYWQKVGISVEPVILAEQRIRDREYIHNFPGFMTIRQPSQPNDFLLRLYSSQAPVAANNYAGRNYPRYMNPEFDAMIDQFYATIPERERYRILGQVVHHISDRVTIMPQFYDAEPVMIATRLANVTAPKVNGHFVTTNAEQWDVRQ